ncbi:tetratricopeptide repeat protein [Xenococcus sp. PCC 7305]|uniref:tetratricopeptide repeat protein n=1 Tax=Xenococcus sp. PCC 7305 TaxID=102125 RepID=UPI0002ABF912|nr:tetratricopeptide repeat protein [Xenococcus sp. PCC 7305]ELS01790.1 tetratricopeptide repeat protein [Xenococcus sp. PCC 7305]
MLKWFSKRKTSESVVQNQGQEKEAVPEVSPSSELTDADYDFLFNQLLEGVAHGWNQFKIIKFFQNLGIRGNQDQWVAWLERLSTKIPDATNDSQRRLGAIMLRLAEVTQSATELGQLSVVSSQIGKKLFLGKTANLIWEYDGVDIVSPSNSTINTTTEENSADLNNIEENIAPEAIATESLELETEGDVLLEEPATVIDESTPVAIPETENPESLPSAEPVISMPESNSLELSEEAVEDLPTENESNSMPESNLLEAPEEALEDLPTETESREKQEIDLDATEQNDQTSVIELVESWFNLGLKQANAGDLPGAIESWHQALQLNPNLAEIWHNLGSALGRLEYYPEAIDSFDHALAIDPQSEQAWNDRAHAFFQIAEWEEAIASWGKAIAINPTNHQFWYYHGCALEQFQRLDEAIASYTKALEISPDFQPARSKYVNLITEL